MLLETSSIIFWIVRGDVSKKAIQKGLFIQGEGVEPGSAQFSLSLHPSDQPLRLVYNNACVHIRSLNQKNISKIYM
jgi:hypothetical protein